MMRLWLIYFTFYKQCPVASGISSGGHVAGTEQSVMKPNILWAPRAWTLTWLIQARVRRVGSSIPYMQLDKCLTDGWTDEGESEEGTNPGTGHPGSKGERASAGNKKGHLCRMLGHDTAEGSWQREEGMWLSFITGTVNSDQGVEEYGPERWSGTRSRRVWVKGSG